MKFFWLALVFAAAGLLLYGCLCPPSLPIKTGEVEPESYCQVDDDCVCGTDLKTNECAFGNKDYVNDTYQCPDYCTGFAGNLEITCDNNACVQKIRVG